MEHTGGVLSSVHPRVGCSATQKGPRFLGQTPGSRSPCRGLESPTPVTSPPLGLFPYCCSGNRLMVHGKVNERYTCRFLQQPGLCPAEGPSHSPHQTRKGPRVPRCQ